MTYRNRSSITAGLLVTVDPATYKTGVALANFATRRVIEGALVRSKDASVFVRAQEMAHGVFEVIDGWGLVGTQVEYRLICEYQQIRSRGRGRTKNPRDILKVALVSGGVNAMLFGQNLKSKQFPEPNEWKGGTKGDIMCARIVEALTDEERAHLKPFLLRNGEYDDNVVDAFGIALWEFRRLPGMVD